MFGLLPISALHWPSSCLANLPPKAGFHGRYSIKTDYCSNISDLLNEIQVQQIIPGCLLGVSFFLIMQSEHAQLNFGLTDACNQIGNPNPSSVIIVLIQKMSMVPFNSSCLIPTPYLQFCPNGNFYSVLISPLYES